MYVELSVVHHHPHPLQTLMPRPADPKKVAARNRKQRLQLLTETLNACRVAISTHHIKTYADVFARLGFANELSQVVSAGKLPADVVAKQDQLIDVRSFNADIQAHLLSYITKQFQNEIAKEQSSDTGTDTQEEVVDAGASQDTETRVDDHRRTDVQQRTDLPEETSESTTQERKDSHPIDGTDWWVDHIPQRKCTLFKHQVKAAKDLMYQLHVQNHRAAMLRAGVGTGKTFIYFEYLLQLWNMNWFKTRPNTFTPWPAIIVTRPSIMEQTRRVGVEYFGLDPVKQFQVFSYDGLRSSAGSNMIDSFTIVEDGIARKRWRWREYMHPLVVLLDECQAAKNEDSQQSQVTQSIAAIEHPDLKVVCSSATPFTRVSESKYFVLNAHVPHSIV